MTKISKMMNHLAVGRSRLNVVEHSFDGIKEPNARTETKPIGGGSDHANRKQCSVGLSSSVFSYSSRLYRIEYCSVGHCLEEQQACMPMEIHRHILTAASPVTQVQMQHQCRPRVAWRPYSSALQNTG